MGALSEMNNSSFVIVHMLFFSKVASLAVNYGFGVSARYSGIPAFRPKFIQFRAK